MRGGVLPPALLCAALAFALAFAPRRAVVPALAVVAVMAVAFASLPLRSAWTEAIFIGCWVGVVATAAAVHLPSGPGRALAVVLATNAGIWAGATVAVAGAPADLARALPVALLVFPARWLVTHRGAIAVKVVASWLIAVAILVGTLPIVPTPGYVADHME